MRTHGWTGAAAVAAVVLTASAGHYVQTVQAMRFEEPAAKPPLVFQAAGPSVAAIQSMVDAYRTALGANNGNTPGPLPGGRREINWDGGGSTATSLVPTPFDGFLINRGGRFTTRGSGFVQAPVDGLATTFGNPSYASIFGAFSPVRLFSPIGSNLTTVRFFVPGGGELPAMTAGFAAVFSDVDRLDGDDEHRRFNGWGPHYEPQTSMAFYGAHGNVLFTADVPASPGDRGMSFVGVLFDDARIAYVRIKTGNAAPGRNDTARRDIVVMDDFLYGEPQPIDDAEALQHLAAVDEN